MRIESFVCSAVTELEDVGIATLWSACKTIVESLSSRRQHQHSPSTTGKLIAPCGHCTARLTDTREVVYFYVLVQLQFDAVVHDTGNTAGGIVMVGQQQVDSILAHLQLVGWNVDCELLVAAALYGTAIDGTVTGERIHDFRTAVNADVDTCHVSRTGNATCQAIHTIALLRQVELDGPRSHLGLSVVPVVGSSAGADGVCQVGWHTFVQFVCPCSITQFVAVAQSVALANAPQFCAEWCCFPVNCT